MPTSLSAPAREVLASSTLDGLALTLPERQLERPLYEEVNRALTNLGGKWSKGKKAHLFKDDPALSLALIAETGAFVDVRKDAQYFPTPEGVVATMLEVAELPRDARILEPSAGAGAIALAAKRVLEEAGVAPRIECVEYLAAHRRILAEAGLKVVGDDFMAFEPEGEYDVVLMNPPFNLEGDSAAYVAHVERAWGMLREGGILVAIVPPGWLTNSSKRQAAFREWVCDFLAFEEIGAGTFKASGTGVNTFMLHGEKAAESWRRAPHNGWGSYHAWHVGLWLDNDHATYLRLRECGDREAFDRLCDDALRQLRTREHVAANLRPADRDELWRHYQEE